MRSLAQSAVLKSAAIAALATVLASHPRLSLWQHRPAPVWYMEAMIFLGGMVLWAFVFGWHTQYTGRPVFTRQVGATPFTVATLAGILAAAGWLLLFDPLLRVKVPEDYPANLKEWAATVLFGLGFTQLFLVFAPFAWALRMFRSRPVAVLFTVSFGAFVALLKAGSAPASVPLSLLSTVVIARIVGGFLSLYFYLRGGLVLVCWWNLLIESRFLLHLESGG